MDDIDRTYHKLLRISFEELKEKIYAADPYGSYTFNCMNADKKWRVQFSYEYIIEENYWTVEEFNKVLHEHYGE